MSSRFLVAPSYVTAQHASAILARHSLRSWPFRQAASRCPVKTYTEPGGQSGEPFHRRFCAECGTPLIWEREGGPRTLVTAGTLDDKSLFKPRISIFCASAQPWVPITEDTENYPGYL